MQRSSRIKKAVNYSDFLDDDDEDFATVKTPPNKKARASVGEPQNDKNREIPSRSEKDVIDLTLTGQGRKERASLDEKLYKRDLEAALVLSLLQSSENTEELLTSSLEEQSKPVDDGPPVLTHCSVDDSCLEDGKSSDLKQDSPPVLSNCSVDVSCLGLDQITSEVITLPATTGQKKPSNNAKHKRKTLQKKKECDEGDEDFQPQSTPESDADFSDPDESEDEEYSVRRKVEKKKISKPVKKTASKVSKKMSQKQAKMSTVRVAVGSKSSASVQHVPALKKTPTTPPITKPATCSSPAGGRTPKWNPPGLVGGSSSTCQSTPMRSPGLGLRLGLSRLARVKPLHPNAAAH